MTKKPLMTCGTIRRMKILMASAESVPFVKVGGLADVVPAVSRELDRLGIKVSVVLPLYRSVREGKWALEKDAKRSPLELSGSFKGKYRIYRTLLPESNVEYLFIEHFEYFDREGIYDDPDTGLAYPDQGERYLFFSKALSQLVISAKEPYDVVHLHDHHVGPAAGYLKLWSSPGKLIFHIHNLGYQGNFPPELFTLSEFPIEWLWAGREAEYYGKFSFMKMGISLSDEVVTVSPQYAKEIVSGPEYGMGMEGILASKGEHLSGILNGIEMRDWDPATDSLIPFNYSNGSMEGKAKNRKALRDQCGLPSPRKDTPVIGMITRLAEQKGIDLIIEGMNDLMELPLQMVILGTGLLSYHDALTELSKKYPEQLSIQLKFDNALAHLIEAGSNMFLMPSQYEPCGLNQMYSLRYGTIPIVRGVGGLLDTVRPVSSDGSDGWGFVFDEMDPDVLVRTVEEALKFYRKKKVWSQIVQRGMSLDFSWKRSAQHYLQLYTKNR